MKSHVKQLRKLTALAALLILAVPAATLAATSLLDANGANAGFWDGVLSPIGADTSTTTTWTTTTAGTVAPVTLPAGNSIQIGNAPSDFNGAFIIITNTLNGNLSANPASLVIVSTNCQVIWLSTGVNARYNHAVTWSVPDGSVFSTSGGNFNFNNQTFTLTGNGTINFSNVLGNNDTTGAIIENMIGGTVNLYQTALGTYGNNTGGHGFTLTNGTLNFVSPQSFANVFGDFQAGADQTVKLNGGALDNLSGAPGTINVNLGSYVIGGDFTYLGSSQSMSLGSAAVLLTGTHQITVSNNTLTIAGVIGDGGSGYGLTKAGNGTLALTGANTYFGPTTVNAGQLIVPTTATGAGPFTNGDGATLTVKVSTVGQSLAMSGLTLGTGTGGTLQFDVGLLGNPAVAPINLGAGALTVNGTGNQISFSSISAIPVYPVTMPLITYGSASGNLSSFTMGSFPAGTPPYSGYISNDTASSTVYLVLTSGPITLPPGPPKLVTWTGVPNGNWDTTTTNWISAGVVTNYSNLTTNGAGDPVVFDDTVAGTTNVILTTTLVPASINVTNNSTNYLFSGTGRISGTASLTKDGTGMLVVDNGGNDDFSGGLTVNAGTVQIGNNDTNGGFGTGSLTVNGELVLSRSDTTLSVSGLAGTGQFTKDGSGTVTLSGVQPFAGNVVVDGGILALSGPNANPSTLSTTTNVVINNGGTLQLDGDNVLGNAAPNANITINAGGVMTGLGSADGGSGTSSHVRGTLTLDGGTLAMGGSSINAANGSWDLQGSPTTVATAGGSVVSTISALSVIPEGAGGTVFDVAAGGAPGGIDLNVTGTLINGTSQHDTGIIKNGSGVMLLDNNNTYAAGTTVNAGTLQLGAAGDAAALASPLGAGPVTLYTGGTLNFASGMGVTVTNAIADDGTGVVLVSGGTNTLAGINTYTGNTFVNAGALVLKNSGSINGSALISVSGATLDISAGGVVASTGALSLTNSAFILGTNIVSGIGSLSVSNTTMSLPLVANFVNVNVAGAFATGGTTNVINVTAVLGYPVYPTNITLVKYGSFVGVDGGNNLTTLGLNLPSFGSPAGYLTNNVANNSIDLVLLNDTLVPIYPLTWNGRTNGVNTGVWDILTTPDWVLTSDGVTPYEFQNTTAVVFDDTAAGSTVVSLNTNVAPGSLTISNAAKNYSFSGSGSITGPGGIVKLNSGMATFAETGGDSFASGVTVGGGSLVLSNANVNIAGGLTVNAGSLTDQHSGTIAGGLTVNGGMALLDQNGVITGGTIINAGTVQVGNNDANGQLPAGTLTDNGALIFNRSDNALNVTTVIAGSGTVTNNGTGTVTLSATETLAGGQFVVNAGTLVMNAGNNAAPNGISSASQLIINNGGTVAVLVDNSLAGHGATAGTLPIFISAGGVLTGAAGADAGVGTSCHLPGEITFDGGTLANSGTQAQTANGSWDIDFGVATAGGSAVSTITASNVIPTVAGGTTFDIPAGTTPSGIDLLVTGTLINGTALHDGGVIKTDTGTMALDNNNSFRGLTINGGTLQIGTANDTNILTAPLGTTTVTLNNGGSVLKFASAAGATIANVISDDDLADALVFVAAGSNTLAAANTYTAPTVVSNGTLVVAGSLASTSVLTFAQGTLAGTGPIAGGVTNSGTLTPGTVTAIGALTCASDVLNLASGTNLMKLNAAASPSNDVLNVAGNLTYAGTLKVLNLGGTYAAGDTFKLFNVTGSISGSFSATNLPAIGGGLGLTWNPSTATLTVVQTANTAPTNITASVSGNILTLSWPADHTGWRLQVQTNSLGTGLNTNWSDVAGAASTNSVSAAINPANGTVFYRMVYP